MAYDLGYNATEKKEDVAWNIANKRAEFVAQLMWEGTRHLQVFNYQKAFSAFGGVRDFINPDCGAAEQVELNGMEEKLIPACERWRRHLTDPNVGKNKEFRNLNTDCRVLCVTYKRRLMDLLKRQGYFPVKKDERFLGK